MDNTARRCVVRAIVCFVFGTGCMVWLSEVLHWLAMDLMRNENAIYVLTEIVLSVVPGQHFSSGCTDRQCDHHLLALSAASGANAHNHTRSGELRHARLGQNRVVGSSGFHLPGRCAACHGPATVRQLGRVDPRDDSERRICDF